MCIQNTELDLVVWIALTIWRLVQIALYNTQWRLSAGRCGCSWHYSGLVRQMLIWPTMYVGPEKESPQVKSLLESIGKWSSAPLYALSTKSKAALALAQNLSPPSASVKSCNAQSWLRDVTPMALQSREYARCAFHPDLGLIINALAELLSAGRSMRRMSATFAIYWASTARKLGNWLKRLWLALYRRNLSKIRNKLELRRLKRLGLRRLERWRKGSEWCTIAGFPVGLYNIRSPWNFI